METNDRRVVFEATEEMLGVFPKGAWVTVRPDEDDDEVTVVVSRSLPKELWPLVIEGRARLRPVDAEGITPHSLWKAFRERVSSAVEGWNEIPSERENIRLLP